MNPTKTIGIVDALESPLVDGVSTARVSEGEFSVGAALLGACVGGCEKAQVSASGW
jgi:hypothetical protein